VKPQWAVDRGQYSDWTFKENIMRSCRYSAFLSALCLLGVSAVGAAEPGKVLRAGMIGLDTSHAPAYVKALNDPKTPAELAGVRVVAAFPGGTRDNPSSWDRVGKYTEQIRGMGVEIVPSIDALLKKVDVVFLESVDGRPHLEQARPVILAGKPLFVDKPCAGSLADVLEIFRLAKEHKVPVFSSSSLRFSSELVKPLKDKKILPVRGCDVYSPCSLEPHHPDLFWYGIHGVEMLFTVMGPNCKQVTRVHTEGTDVVVGLWADGSVGCYRGLRDGKKGYGATIFGEKGLATMTKYDGYQPLLVEIVKFFKTGKPPVACEDTIAIFAFMEGADESKRQGGKPVSIADVLAKAGKKK
jgi:predicted dehydrogenase